MIVNRRVTDDSSAYPQPLPAPAVVKIEDSPSPPLIPDALPVQPSRLQLDPSSASSSTAQPPSMQQPFDERDPEGYLRKCAGYNKRTGKRCEKVFGKGTLNSRNGINSNPVFLPTCHSHKGQLFHAGRCQYSDPAGRRCDRLFKWIKPYFQLCNEHMGHPDTPCHLMRLPLELRREVYRYLIPQGPIGSSTMPQHQPAPSPPPPPPPPVYNAAPAPMSGPMPPFVNMTTAGGYLAVPSNQPPPSGGSTTFPSQPPPRSGRRISFMPLLLVNHQITAEVLDMLYGTIPFTIDIRKDGTFMCGRRLLEAKPAEGGPFPPMSAASDESLEKFLKAFRFGAVKNYHVDVLVENRQQAGSAGPVMGAPRRCGRQPWWSEEVELYDLRDYVSVAVSGILAKATNLTRLTVRVAVLGFTWSERDFITKLQTVVEPFTRLRKVVQPKLLGVYDGQASSNYSWMMPLSSSANSLYSVPRLPTQKSLLESNADLNGAFDEYKKTWEQTISQNTSPPPRPPIRAMFTELKNFYTKLHNFIPDIYRSGQHSFLHRARVAREKEDVLAFREVRNELIGYWNQYLEEEEQKRDAMNQKMCQMLDVDSYPSADIEPEKERSITPSEPGSPDYLEILQAADDNSSLSGQISNVQQLRRQLLIQRQMMFRMQQAQQVHFRNQPAVQRPVGPPATIRCGFRPVAQPTPSSSSATAASASASASTSTSTISEASSSSSTTLKCTKPPDTHPDAFSPVGSPDAMLFTPSITYPDPAPAPSTSPYLQDPQLLLTQMEAEQARHNMQIQQAHVQAQYQAQQQYQQQAQEQQQQQQQLQHFQQQQQQPVAQPAAWNTTNSFGKRGIADVDVNEEDGEEGRRGWAKRHQQQLQQGINSTQMSDRNDYVVIGDVKGKGRAVFIEIED